jgi:hypothetical protein
MIGGEFCISMPRRILPAIAMLPGRTEKRFPWRNIGSPLATPKMVKVVNSGADFLTRRATQIASRFHDAAKILLATSPVWTLMTTAAD